MSSHTSGPWFVTIDGTLTANHPVITTHEHSDDFEEREDVAEISLPVWTRPNGPTGRKKRARAAEAMANANLIAAAPDLLAVCEVALEIVERGSLAPNNLRSLMFALRAALAKARGT